MDSDADPLPPHEHRRVDQQRARVEDALTVPAIESEPVERERRGIHTRIEALEERHVLGRTDVDDRSTVVRHRHGAQC